MNHLVEILMSKLICLIMQQKLILKMQQGTPKLTVKSDLVSLKELDIHKLVLVTVDFQ